MSAVRRPLKWQINLPIAAISGQKIGGGKILLVTEQHEEATVWTEEVLEDGADTVALTREITVIGTGHKVPNDYDHIGSLSTQGGNFIWHLYEKVLF